MNKETLEKWWPQMEAFKAGKAIEERWIHQPALSEWKETSNPAFCDHPYYECRVKPDPDKWADVRKAFEDGKLIEVQRNDGTWYQCAEPAFDKHGIYRIAPDRPKPDAPSPQWIRWWTEATENAFTAEEAWKTLGLPQVPEPALEKWAAERKAFTDGKKVEWAWLTGPCGTIWHETTEPEWDNPVVCFRIAPEQPQTEKWAEERKAFAEGKHIEVRHKFAEAKWTCCPDPSWSCMFDYRIALEQPDRWASVREAQAQGEKVQFRVRIGKDFPWGKWQTWKTQAIDDEHARNPNLQFRVAPPKKWRPFTAEEVPVGKVLVHKGDETTRCLITGTEEMNNDAGTITLVYLTGIVFSSSDILRLLTFEDGSPCGVEIEEEEK